MQGSQCACRRETHRCCPPPLAPSLTYPSIDFLAHSSAARIACPSCFVSSHPSLNLDVWQPDLSRISTNSLNQPLPHSIARAAPSHTSVYIFDHRRHLNTPNVANLPSILDSCARRSLSFHAYRLSNNSLAVVLQLTAASLVASVASVLHTPSSCKSGAC